MSAHHLSPSTATHLIMTRLGKQYFSILTNCKQVNVFMYMYVPSVIGASTFLYSQSNSADKHMILVNLFDGNDTDYASSLQL